MTKFTVHCSESIGKLVLIELDKQGLPIFPEDSWFPSKVEVTSPEGDVYVFPIYRWIDDNQVHRFREGRGLGIYLDSRQKNTRGPIVLIFMFSKLSLHSSLKPWETLKTPTFWGGTVASGSWRKGRKTIGEIPWSSVNLTTFCLSTDMFTSWLFSPAGMCMHREFPTSWRLMVLFLCLVRSASPSPRRQSSILLPLLGESIDLYWKECCVFSL